jgi:hypothetical protein
MLSVGKISHIFAIFKLNLMKIFFAATIRKMLTSDAKNVVSRHKPRLMTLVVTERLRY